MGQTKAVDSPSPKPFLVSLTLTICGTPYRVTPIRRGVGIVAYQLAKAATGPYTITRGPGGMTCTCPGFGFRKSASDACKHLRAAESVGLI